MFAVKPHGFCSLPVKNVAVGFGFRLEFGFGAPRDVVSGTKLNSLKGSPTSLGAFFGTHHPKMFQKMDWDNK